MMRKIVRVFVASPFEGILGNDFFKNFVVTFDFRSTTVTFERA